MAAGVGNFPVLVRLIDDLHIDMDLAESGGADIRFANSDGDHLAYEIERWTDGQSPDSAEIWVLADTIIGNNSSQYITMYYDNDGATSRSSGAKVFQTSNGFTSIYHLEENSNNNADGYQDATANAHHGQGNNIAVGTADVQGMIGMAQQLDGIDDWIDIGGHSHLAGSSELTLSMWIKTTDFNTRTTHSVLEISVYNNGVPNITSLPIMRTQSDGDLIAGGRGSGLEGVYWIDNTDLVYDTLGFHHFTVTFNLETGASIIYLDGVEIDNETKAYEQTYFENLPNTSGAIGAQDDGSSSWAKMIVDEVRITKAERSADWIKLEYMNQRAVDKLCVIEDYSNWSNSQSIVLNTTKTGADVSGDVGRFPVLVRLIEGHHLDFSTANEGSSIRFANSDGDHLSYEIERWTTSSSPDSAEIWVFADTIYGDNSSQYITMHWGNGNAVDRSDGEMVFSTGNGFAGGVPPGQQPGRCNDQFP